MSSPDQDLLGCVNDLDYIYMKQIEKIQFMRTRLSNFKNLLNEEANLKIKMQKLSNDPSSFGEVQSHISNFDNPNNFENEIEIN